MTPQDALALQIGRAVLDLHIARQLIETQAARIAELEASASPVPTGKDDPSES